MSSPVVRDQAIPAKVIQVVVALVINEQKEVLIARRQSGQHLAGFWEFPGGKVEAGESFACAVARELYEEVGIQVASSDFLFDITHSYLKKDVKLLVHHVTSFSGTAFGSEGQEVKWVALDELSDYTFPPANVDIVSYLQATYL